MNHPTPTMQPSPPAITTPRSRRRVSHFAPRTSHFGFTLSEVLIALGILALGTVAVASLFPTAAFLQKEAVKETLRQNHTRSADAVLQGVGINNSTLLNFIRLIEVEPTGYAPYAARTAITDPAYDVFALAEIDLTTVDGAGLPDATAGGAEPDMTFDGAIERDDSYVYDQNPVAYYPYGRFPEALRSLPSTIPGVVNGGTEFRDREVYWVPLVRAGLEASEIYPDWNIYVFVLQPDSQLRSDNVYAAANYSPTFDNLICANPLDLNYFPKVFRVPVVWSDTAPKRAEPDFDGNGTADGNLYGYVKPGEKVLGDNGVIYRVSQIAPPGTPNAGTMILAEDTDYSPLNQRDLGAIWVAPAPGKQSPPFPGSEFVAAVNQNSPLADIRLLSNTVVRTNDY